MISWFHRHGRTHALAEMLGVDDRAIYPEVRIPRLRLLSTLLRYVLSTFLTTVALLRARRRDMTVIVVVPPVFPVLLARVLLKPSRLIVDAHSGAFVGKRWEWSVPLLRRSCRGIAALIVTNEELLQGEPVDCPVIVLHDPFEHWEETEPREPAYVLVPLGGGDDEPVEAIVEALGASGLEIIISGIGYPSRLPENVRPVGFVSVEEYADLVRHATVMVGVTDEDFTMQRVGYEAMFAGKSLVTSDFPLLRRFFEDAAVYVQPRDSHSIAEGLAKAWQDAERLAVRMREVRIARAREQESAMAELRRLMA